MGNSKKVSKNEEGDDRTLLLQSNGNSTTLFDVSITEDGRKW